jgi:hypothetical protein
MQNLPPSNRHLYSFPYPSFLISHLRPPPASRLLQNRGNLLAPTAAARSPTGTDTDSKTINLASADVGAHADITAPSATVSTSDPTAVTWDFVDNGGCNTSDPASCLDFIWVFAIVNEPGLPEDEVYAEKIMTPTTTGTTIPGGTFQANTGYLIDVETRRGAIVTVATDKGHSVTVYRGTADINETFVTGGPSAVPMLGTGLMPLLLLLGATGYAAIRRRR